ncbi:hypothetical protein [Aliiroseovarius crassostreae]|uniref:hypothetical protein n=1 Tax=Aliiroseovarius crassostreae TaxID=154981 RepID=UPI0021FF3C4C|nr:hypothetical protein [Aliiroseovarius crassostreae]UWP88475.1 hypothetical protein K3J57_11290 [Aliiroseovarius crassostreae]UWQ01129.1 hypothetical protein K3X44_11575 [Aliiroseovarius crassostreae]
MTLPEFLSQGEPARLFPVLSTTSKEGRATSVFLATLSSTREFSASLLQSLGQRYGVRSHLEAFTEVVFSNGVKARQDRPDGLIVLRTGTREWRALIEAKIGNAQLTAEQVDRYRNIAKDHGCDCVITISNQFATTPASHPLEEVRKSRSKIPVYHWSWMFILTTADLLLSNQEVADDDQAFILSEFHRFLTHESTGVRGFDRMPPEWTELNKLVSAGGQILAKSVEARAVLEAWHQETKDLSMILSRQTDAVVLQRLSRKHKNDPALRQKDELLQLREQKRLSVTLDIPDAAAPLDVVVDLTRRSVDVGMNLRAPEDKVSTKARLNWLMRQIRSEATEELYIRLQWPGRSENTQFSFKDLLECPGICEEGKQGKSPVGFSIFYSRRLGARFTQQVNFVADLEKLVPEFYREIGQNLMAWRRPAPKIKPTEDDLEDLEEGR